MKMKKLFYLIDAHPRWAMHFELVPPYLDPPQLPGTDFVLLRRKQVRDILEPHTRFPDAVMQDIESVPFSIAELKCLARADLMERLA